MVVSSQRLGTGGGSLSLKQMWLGLDAAQQDMDTVNVNVLTQDLHVGTEPW
jgi:hypothetical protein